jgi:hypothetical protein
MPVQVSTEILTKIQEQFPRMVGIFYYGPHKFKTAHDLSPRIFPMSMLKEERIGPCENGSWPVFLAGFLFPTVALTGNNSTDPGVFFLCVF